MIQLDRVARAHGAHELFRDLSWKIEGRCRAGLVGPNGAGKSTLLRLLIGEDRPDEGEVHRPRNVRVGYLPQEIEACGEGTVLETATALSPELGGVEKELERLAGEMERLAPDDPEAAALTARYGELQARFEALGGSDLEARAKMVLGGLGVGPERFDRSISELSGGWRMRVLLARLLVSGPDVLLLDEPTNHLDLETIGWLEGFLETFPGALVVVSHDRYFLNRMADEIVELERGQLTRWAGNYEAYIEAKQVREAGLVKAAKQQQREIAATERFIERFRYKNTKAKAVQSRVKALDRLERVQTSDQTRAIRFEFPQPPRSGDIVFRVESMQKAYGEHPVFTGADLLLQRRDRVALIGPNGAGKSTLLKMLAGRLEADGGNVEIGHNVSVHYYAQHQLDELDPGSSILEQMQRAAPELETQRLRSLLGVFLFRGDEVDKKVQVLSGGERARVALARMLVRPANLLLLDEPTNHLDLRSREVLEDALNSFGGTVVLISHDRYFINRVTTSVAEVGGGRVERYDGDYDTFIDWKRRRAEAAAEQLEQASGATNGQPATKSERHQRKEDKRREAEERNRRYRERKIILDQLEPLEQQIESTEQAINDLEARQSDPATYSDPEQAARVARDKSDAERRLAALYETWERLSATLPAEDPPTD